MTRLSTVLEAAGFSGAAEATAEGIVAAESGGNASAHNDVPPDDSYGLGQINMIGALGPERRRRFGLSSNADLYDPYVNARVMYALSGGGRDWSPWSTFLNGAYRAGYGRDLNITRGTSSTSSGADSGGTVQPAGLLGSIGGAIVKPGVLLLGIGAGLGLIVLGANKATGNPAGKAAKAASSLPVLPIPV